MKKFSPIIYINRVLKRLVFEFEEAAYAGTPGLVGSARENPARSRLEGLLPGISAVGSGLVIDSYDNVSRQQDIVIYERDFCPIFTINNSPESTYYPCEGVIAVGEVKSEMGEKELKDAFEKISSVKKLKRHLNPTGSILDKESTVAFRGYGSAISVSGTKSEEFDQNKKELDQIFGFILCNGFSLKSETMLDKAAKLWKQYPSSEAPNLIISLNNGFMQPIIIDSRGASKMSHSLMNAKNISYINDSELGFSILLRNLHVAIRRGRTVDSWAFHRYFEDRNRTTCQISMSYNFDNDQITKY